MLAAVFVMLAATLPATLLPGSAAAAGSQPEHRLLLDVHSFQPSIVTPGTDTISVTGTVRNVGDRPVHDIEVRLQSGEPLRSGQRLLADLAGVEDPDRAMSLFQPVTDVLQPGQSTRLRLRVPVAQLRMSEPGVYPVLININGRPDYGGPARLIAVNTLVPVHGRGQRAAGTPLPTTLLWPIAELQPRLVGTTANGQPLLSDDQLARSLAPGGRLYGLVDAVKQAEQRHPGVLTGLCFAIDPDLVDTVQAMASGYRVRTAGGDKPGKGQQVAQGWLAELRGVTAGQCTFSLPFADADLAALARAGVVGLEQEAVSSQVVASALPQAEVLPHVVWPIGGTLDQRTLSDLADAGNATVLVDPQALDNAASTGPLPISGASPARAVELDPLVSAALGGLSPHVDLAPGARPLSIPAAVVPGLAAQSGLAALAYRAEFDSEDPGTAGTTLIAPPHRWDVREDQLRSLLQAMVGLIRAGAVAPQSMAQLLQAPSSEAPASLVYSPEAAAKEIPPDITEAIARANAHQRDLIGAMRTDNAARIEPVQVTAGIRTALLRATSGAWRDAGRHAAQRARDDALARLDKLTGQVAVASPGRPISLASSDSPLPVTIVNDLPAGVTVHLNLSAKGGLQLTQPADQMVPAKSQRTVYVKTRVLRSGHFAVDVSLTTPSGATQFGTPTRLRLTSTAYGTITLVVTGTAFGLLILLAGRRIYRRVRQHGSGAHTEPDSPRAADGPAGPAESPSERSTNRQ